MSANDCNGHNGHDTDECTASEPNWESVARGALAELFFSRKHDLQNSLGTIEARLDRLSDDDLTAEHIKQFRRDFYDVQRLVEEDIVPLVDGVEPYEGANTNLTMGNLAEFLDVRWEDVRDLPRESEIGDDETEDDDE
ncbi:hypothetical protein ACERIT_15210 (plasmid) [Halopenitus sp. H-Gu1]|uniref:hypothetical protein n=1 Tax=Halopenitus sp. H-Gu1 TaxID=3242697 RepID=UPI00359D408F